MPFGDEVTVPVPDPVLVTTSGRMIVKLAVTFWSALIVMTHGPVPAHPPPLQPANTESLRGDAVNVTCVPSSTVSEQVPGQASPPGVEVTVPPPLPDVATVTV